MFLRLFSFALVLFLGGCSPASLVDVTKENTPQNNNHLVSFPNLPSYSEEGFNLIVNEETGGESYYNRNPHPEWPEGNSGITEGIGYDNSTVSVENILSDWSVLPQNDVERLAATQPYSGSAAKAKLKEVKDILVTWENANIEFKNIDLVRFYLLTQKTFPGFDNLDPKCQFALISLTYNRGNSMIGNSRLEMRNIRTLVNSNNIDYKAIALQFRKMIRIWKGTSIEEDMTNRRNDEANLVMECVNN